VQVTEPAATGEIKGFFLLNEANMGSNKASLDYFDYASGTYHRNIFAERNPGVVKELGDVGNDLQIHGERLYAVINCSHLVEVMDVATAGHVGTVSIPNCRYIVFKDNYAYVSSFVGPVQIDPNARLGYVAKVDLATLKVVGECTVGYQPEEMAIAGGKLYVANSGGYLVDKYDRTVSVIDLDTFTEVKKIDVAINLHRLELDRYGNLWVSSRGDRAGVPSRLHVIDTRTDEVTHTLDLPASNMTRHDDLLYVSHAGEDKTISWAVVDTGTKQIVGRNFITDGTDRAITIPYGVAVNPAGGEIFVTDAKDYLTPGTIHCYTPDGKHKWSATAGDIPAHIAFTTQKLLPPGEKPEPKPEGPSPYITKVLDFMPAPGQFINEVPAFEQGDTRETMNLKALAAIGNNAGGMISLGGWGGYVVVGFDHTIENVRGKCDFRVSGNAYDGNSEPGVIEVARDANGNGMPDPDEWYEIVGSAHGGIVGETWWQQATDAGADTRVLPGYEITYHRPDAEPTSPDGYADYIRWEDNRGKEGYIAKNSFHTQSWYPQWAGETLTLSGTRLPQNGFAEGGAFVLHRFRHGYADNAPNNDEGSAIDIEWAVDAHGEKANLPGVDFIRIYTGVLQQNGPIGECSTEVSGVEDLHLLGIDMDANIQ
jgi:DNA-binding beta-propeller fold protein YncE